MLKKLVLAAVVAASLTTPAPVAHAGIVRSGCAFEAVAEENVTGGQDTFTGAGYGYALFDDAGTHLLRCYVTVDGVEQASTPTESGTGMVVTSGQMTYNAAEGATVDLCTEVDGVTIECGTASGTQLLPQEVIDAIEVLCALLPPPPLSDCPPYTLVANLDQILPP
jgi:hypothetical protein